jgi:hypothetical protein
VELQLKAVTRRYDLSHLTPREAPPDVAPQVVEDAPVRALLLLL